MTEKNRNLSSFCCSFSSFSPFAGGDLQNRFCCHLPTLYKPAPTWINNKAAIAPAATSIPMMKAMIVYLHWPLTPRFDMAFPPLQEDY
jgi:hypothetical protein